MDIHSFNYCRAQAKAHYYGAYLLACTLPSVKKNALLSLLAFDATLSMVAQRCHEEMAAHIRYAWWREHVALSEKGQPVMQAVQETGLSLPLLHAIIDEHQLAWPGVASSETVEKFLGQYPQYAFIKGCREVKISTVLRLLLGIRPTAGREG